jgi:glycosyltransferase involved in cell wall biosynthesis
MSSYNIVLLRPLHGDGHRVFLEVAKLLYHSFRSLGLHCSVQINRTDPSAVNILLGYHWLGDPDEVRATRSIIYQLEQLSDREGHFAAGRLKVLEAAREIWDYSAENVAFLRARGLGRVKLLPLGYHPTLETVPRTAPDIDVLFYGFLNRRRNDLLESLRDSCRVKYLVGVFADERDRYIARAKIVLNVHYYAAQIMEQVRIAYLLANRRFVLSEESPHDPYPGGIVTAPYHRLPDVCLQYLEAEEERARVARTGHELFRQRPMTEYLRAVLERPLTPPSLAGVQDAGSYPVAPRVVPRTGGPRVLVVCPDTDVPTGGVRGLYRQAEVLARHGIEASVLHRTAGFRCTWFRHAAHVSYAASTTPRPEDYLVIPEVYGPDSALTAPSVKKVIANQGCYLTFQGYSLDPGDLRTPYTHPDTVAVQVCSEDSRAYLAHVFPHVRILRIRPGIDTSLFAFERTKRRQIAFMPRRGFADAVQVINILKFRRALAGFELVPIHDRPHEQVAELLRHALLFLSFGPAEGLSRPPAEAMASGCLVIGYHGRGGREFFHPEFSYPVEVGDIVGFARIVEDVIRDYDADPAPFHEKAERASAYIRAHYSLEQEERDIVECWRTILADRGAGVRG